jgi:hypothetical protein
MTEQATEAGREWDQEDIDNEVFRDEEECDHIEASVDILTGIMECHCGWRHWMTSEEFKAWSENEAKLYEDYAAAMEAS